MVHQLLAPGSWLPTFHLDDENGGRLAEIETNGHLTTFGYDALGRRISRSVGLSRGDAGGTLNRADPVAVFAPLTAVANCASVGKVKDSERGNEDVKGRK